MVRPSRPSRAVGFTQKSLEMRTGAKGVTAGRCRAARQQPRLRCGGASAVMGRRMVPPHRPMRAMAHLSGIGLASTNRFLCTGISWNWISMARRTSPARAASHSSRIRRGATLAVTLTLPWPPHSISATAVGSSPEYTAKFFGRSRISHCARSMLPVASLMPMMPGTCARRSTVSCCMSATDAAGHVVEDGGQVAHGFGNRLEVLVLALLRGLVVVGHDLQLAVGAHPLGEPGQLDGFGGGVGAAAGHDRHALGGLLDADADDLAVLLDVRPWATRPWCPPRRCSRCLRRCASRSVCAGWGSRRCRLRAWG